MCQVRPLTTRTAFHSKAGPSRLPAVTRPRAALPRNLRRAPFGARKLADSGCGAGGRAQAPQRQTLTTQEIGSCYQGIDSGSSSIRVIRVIRG